ncbi:MICAL-like protein 1 [Panicum miliaceum]|uniref:MICAL-like protein 1 n=1 Tax=Panicum miliaceum TaxID=4540 RepID=A0A3L6RXA0_PANMI|nr:MICAL-like protein 1 [Panicum miliaceum]
MSAPGASSGSQAAAASQSVGSRPQTRPRPAANLATLPSDSATPASDSATTGNLEVKVKPAATVTPRCSPATKLSRPRTSVPAAASPRLSTPDPRRRPPHQLHREQPQAAPPATPRKENRLPPPSTETVASPGTPRPRTTMLSRSRSMIKDRGCTSVAVRESPRPPRFQSPRASYDSAGNLKEPALPLHADAIAVMKSSLCSSKQPAVLDDLKKASAIAPEPFHPRRSGNGVEPASTPPVIPRDEPDSSEIAPASDGNAATKSDHEHADQSSDKFGSVEITCDSDTEPSYVYIKKDRDEQTPRPCQASTGLGTCPGSERPRSDNRNSDNVDDTMESTGSNDVSGETDAEEASRRESSESLYSNFPAPQRHRAIAGIRRLTTATEVEDGGKSLPVPTTPRSSVTVSITVQPPMDAVTGLKRFLTFGKKNSKGGEAAAAIVERTSHSMAPAPPHGDGCVSGEWPAGDSAKARSGSSDVASADDPDSSYVISPHEQPPAGAWAGTAQLGAGRPGRLWPRTTGAAALLAGSPEGRETGVLVVHSGGRWGSCPTVPCGVAAMSGFQNGSRACARCVVVARLGTVKVRRALGGSSRETVVEARSNVPACLQRPGLSA